MSFDFDIVLRYGPLLLSGLWTTVYICVLASLLALAGGALERRFGRAS